LTSIKTEITLKPSGQSVSLPSKININGAISPPLPGELVELRYVDPSGGVKSKALVIQKDGSFTDDFRPELGGKWEVSAAFAGEGFYLSSKSPVVTFNVENQNETTNNSVYLLQLNAKGSSGNNEEVTYPISYVLEGGRITSMSINPLDKSLNIVIEPSLGTATGARSLKIELPKIIIDAPQSTYQVSINGKTADFQELDSTQPDAIRSLTIPLSSQTKQVTITGTHLIPEFSGISLVILALIISALVGYGRLVVMKQRSVAKLW
jgi:hypothetical protein